MVKSLAEKEKGLAANLDRLKEDLGFGISFDVIIREFRIGGRDAALVAIDGFIKDEIIQRLMEVLFAARHEELLPNTIEKLINQKVTYIETSRAKKIEEVEDAVLAGQTALLVDGEAEFILIDARTYPARGPEEPDLERVLRGSRDGLVETIVFNTALIRRRLRDPGLRVRLYSVGARSKTDVALLYINDIADGGMIREIERRIKKLRVDGLPMAEKTLEEFILENRKWWNPFPTVRYTERPDVAAVHLLEGHAVILVDTSPSAMILPVTIFHHLQHAEEYREDVVTGGYIRLVRYFGIFLSWVITPLWVLVSLNPWLLPEGLRFIGPQETGQVPLILQFILVEIGIDLIRIALIHTPNALATSLGFIGAILLGQMAVEVGLFATETIMYTALAALGTFATPSMEFGMAVRLFRLLYLGLLWVAGLPGFVAGLLLTFILLVRTNSLGTPYLWPLIPFNGRALWAVLMRLPVPLTLRRPFFLDPEDPDRRRR